jgi:hypothetical protein
LEDPFPASTKLISGGVATSELEIVANTSERKSIVLQAIASATFPSPTNKNPISGKNDNSNFTIRDIKTFVPVTIKPAKAFQDQVVEAVDSGTIIFNKFSAAVTTLGVTVSGIIGFVALWKKRSSKGKTDYKKETSLGSPF